MRVGVYPGTFDPITNGHLDIIERALNIFDKVVVAIAIDNMKNSFFTIEERVSLLEEVLKPYGDKIEVDVFSGLSINYIKEKNSNVLIRGLRALSDFEYEYQLSHMNKSLDKSVETMFLMTSVQYAFVSSSLIKQIISLGGELKDFLPTVVEEKIKEKFKESI